LLNKVKQTNIKITDMNSQKMEKVVTPVIEKLEKLSQVTLAAELSWCWGSYQNDQNASGLVEKSEAALNLFRAAREKNSKSVAKKLVEDLESALA
jgi:hypothetical protein